MSLLLNLLEKNDNGAACAGEESDIARRNVSGAYKGRRTGGHKISSDGIAVDFRFVSNTVSPVEIIARGLDGSRS